MAKRFTDTDKWKRPWFRGLPLNAKLVWFYILDNVDHCGVWPADFDLLEFQTGVKVSRDEFENWFEGKFVVLGQDKYFIPSFVTFQQGELSASKNAHRPILAFLEKNGLSLDEVPNPSGSHRDPIGMGPSKSKGKGNSTSKEGGVGETALPVEPPPFVARPQLPPSTFVHESKPLDAGELDLCYQEWLATLAHYKAARAKLLPAEQLEIARAAQRQGNATAVVYALRGARYEPKTERFNPAEYLKINRVLDPEHFNRFMNLGIQAEHKKAQGG